MNDQREMWNKKHAEHEHANQEDVVHELAREITSQLGPGQKLLELGCGVSADARHFAGLGLEVTSTDFSDVVIDQNRAKAALPNLLFQVLDMTEPFPYEPATFDVVYAHLSLHYYSEKVTEQVFAEIARVLKSGGMLYFSCKSVDDPKYGEGEEIEPGIFSRNGHIRHFFSLEYTQSLVSQQFEVVKLETAEGDYVDGHSAFIHCWAKKKEN